jgi:ABC-type microcin C transport system duplicated ATPase subunit YejF
MASAMRSIPEIIDVDDEPLLAFKGLHVRFTTAEGVVEAVRGVNLSVGRGETVAIVDGAIGG